MTIRILAAAAALGLCVAGAQGALISFAADSNPFSPTLQGTFDPNAKITNIGDRDPTMLTLLTDPDEDGPMGPITNDVSLVLSFSLDYVSSQQVFPGIFTHSFAVTGFFEFRDANTGGLYFRGTLEPGLGVFVGLGTATKIMSAGIAGHDMTYTIGALGAAIVGFGGVRDGGDFSFTLTAINNGAGAALIFEEGSAVGIADFITESSFSGSFVPSPGACALALLSGAVAYRRRRSA